MIFDRSSVIDCDVETQILKTIDDIEMQHDVVILHAVESGSRAWGFHSIDSDYDVRFFYVHKRDWYLSIYSGRDVIERPICNIYDVSGWDLKKTLHLAMKSNAVVMEWLQSPVIYKTNTIFCNDLRSFYLESFDPKVLSYHYLSAITRQMDQSWRISNEIKIKKYFYMLRPAMALRWINMRSGLDIPPMNLQELIEQSDVNANIKECIDDLIFKKVKLEESNLTPRIDILDNFINFEYQKAKENIDNMKARKHSSSLQADMLFQEWLP